MPPSPLLPGAWNGDEPVRWYYLEGESAPSHLESRVFSCLYPWDDMFWKLRSSVPLSHRLFLGLSRSAIQRQSLALLGGR